MLARLLPCLLVYFVCATSAPAQTIRTAGLTNYCLNMPTTTSSSAAVEGGKYWCDKAVDGNPGTMWATADHASPPQWLQVDFDEPRAIDTLVIGQSSLVSLYANAQEIEISFSDGEPVASELADDWNPQIVRFDSRVTTSVRLTFVSAYELRHYFGLRELQAFSDPDDKIGVVQSPRKRWESIDLTATGRDVHPCVNKTPADVEHALRNIAGHQWAADYADGVRAQADAWLERSDEWLLAQIPEPGSCFAYGFTGCPICGSRWGTWGGARCSFDNPGQVTCSKGHVLPDADHPDAGEGYVGEDGRIHYFVGSYNSWVVETFQFKALRPLCLTYLLTGDERYAQKAAVILDGLAAVYPECDAGSWDYPSNPPSGRFSRPWYQVARVLIHYVDFYDELFNSASLDEPSIIGGMTRRQNIEENLLRNGAWYCYEQSLKGGLNNGYSDYIRGALAVGCVLGIESYVEWALDGPYGIRSIIANNADRDGRYFESSLGYALHARSLYLTFTEPLLNYRSDKYPEGANVYEDPKFLSFYFLPDALFDCAGHGPRYGDSGPDIVAGSPDHPLFSATDYKFAEMLYARTAGELREPFAAALRYLTGDRAEELRAGSGNKMWLLFHAGDLDGLDADVQTTRDRLSHTDFFGQKGIAILRGGESSEAQAVLLRYGQALNHGHNDDLNLNYYALGREVTYDLGYALGSTHTQVGWAKQTAAHNLVVVNETRQHLGGGTGGDLMLLGEMPGLRLVEADAPAAYATEGVEQYQRTLALIGEGYDRYLVDIFRVAGGNQHDYMFHASADELTVEGLVLGDTEPGSLAGPEYDWGHRQQNDGDLSGVPARPYWRAPPGNGYGFLVDVRRADADGPWSATWTIDAAREARLRLIYPSQPGTEVITANAPGLYPSYPRTAAICARRTGENLRSVFASVIEPTVAEDYDNVTRSGAMMATADTTGGSTKFISSLDVLLFKADAPGDRMTFTASVPEEGDYRLIACHYNSPSYGEMRLLLDGEPAGESFRGTADVVGPSEPLDLGTRHLTAGDHEWALEAIAPDAGGNHWMGLTFVAFDPVDQAAQRDTSPRIVSVDRLTPDGGGDAVGLRIVGRDGMTDHVFSALDSAERVFGDFTVAARFARVRTDDVGLVQANLVGGTRLTVGELVVELPLDAWRGSVVEVDEAAREVVLDCELPAGDVLRGQAIAFSNPGYSRNTVYHIDRVTVADGRSRVRVREATFILGKALLDEAPVDEHTITSLVPHEYAKTMAGGSIPEEFNFFRGKLLASADGGISTTVTGVKFTQPMQITVDSSAGMNAGDELYYHDVRPGDEALVQVQCTITRQPDGSLETDCPLPARIN